MGWREIIIKHVRPNSVLVLNNGPFHKEQSKVFNIYFKERWNERMDKKEKYIIIEIYAEARFIQFN